MLLWQAVWLLGFYCLFRNRSQGSDHNENFIQFLPALHWWGGDVICLWWKILQAESRAGSRWGITPGVSPWCCLWLPHFTFPAASAPRNSSALCGLEGLWAYQERKMNRQWSFWAQVTGGSCPVANISPLLSCPGPALHAQPQRGVTTSSNKKTIWKSEEPRALWMI